MGVSTMCRALDRLGLALKRTLTATKRDEDLVVFLDETSTQMVMTRRCGRAPGGVRAVGSVPHNHGFHVICLVVMGTAGMHERYGFDPAETGNLLVSGFWSGWSRHCVREPPWSWYT